MFYVSRSPDRVTFTMSKQTNKHKLSKTVLEMKFMKKTKIQQEKVNFSHKSCKNVLNVSELIVITERRGDREPRRAHRSED